MDRMIHSPLSSSSSFPVKVIFGKDSGDDDMSHLQNSPIHRLESRRDRISTRFSPAAIAPSTPHNNGVWSVLLFGNDSQKADDDSHGDSLASRSLASDLTGVSRISHRALHPLLPLCSLQNIDALPKAKKKTVKKKKAAAKQKSKKKPRNLPKSCSAPVS